MNVNDAGVDALRCERLRRLLCKVYHIPRSDERHVTSVAIGHTATDLEVIVRKLGRQVRHGESSEAEIHGALVQDRRLHRVICLVRVGGANDRHPGNRAHKRHILKALVRRAVLTDGDARVCRTDLDVQVRVADAVPHLLEGASRRKHREGGRERNSPRRRDPRGDAHHVSFRDPAIEEPLGKLLLEHSRFCRRRQIGVENDKVILLAELDERLAVGFSCCFHFRHVRILTQDFL